MSARSPVKLNTLFLKEWVTVTLSVRKTISYFKGRMAVNRLPLNKSNAKNSSSKRVVILKKYLLSKIICFIITSEKMDGCNYSVK